MTPSARASQDWERREKINGRPRTLRAGKPHRAALILPEVQQYLDRELFWIDSPPSVGWALAVECETGVEITRLSLAEGVHWFSGAAISFARGLICVGRHPRIVKNNGRPKVM